MCKCITFILNTGSRLKQVIHNNIPLSSLAIRKLINYSKGGTGWRYWNRVGFILTNRIQGSFNFHLKTVVGNTEQQSLMLNPQ